MAVTEQKLFITDEGREVLVDAFSSNENKLDILNVASAKIGMNGDDNHDSTYSMERFANDEVLNGNAINIDASDDGFWGIVKRSNGTTLTITCTIPSSTTSAVTCNQLMIYVDYSLSTAVRESKKSFIYGVFPDFTKNVGDDLLFTITLEF